MMRTAASTNMFRAMERGRGVAGVVSTVPIRTYATAGLSPTRGPIHSRRLPKVPNPRPMILFTMVFAGLTWSAFTLVATNKERLSSSIFKDVVGQLKVSPQVQELLNAPLPSQTSKGKDKPVSLKQEWWLAGSPYIRGAVNMMKGRIDLSFKITTLASSTTPRTATVYFTSIRPEKSAAFEIIRFLVVQDDAPHESVSLLESAYFDFH